MIDGYVNDKLNELSQSSQTPVCFFPTTRARQEFNNEMLQLLASKIHDLVCTDQIDQTSSNESGPKKQKIGYKS